MVFIYRFDCQNIFDWSNKECQTCECFCDCASDKAAEEKEMIQTINNDDNDDCIVIEDIPF